MRLGGQNEGPRLARVARLGAAAGALAAFADAVSALLQPSAAGVRGEVAFGCVVVDVLTGAVLAPLLAMAWAVLEALGRRLAAAWPRVPRGIAESLPLAIVVVLWLAHDAASLFSGPGISKTVLGLVGRRLFPLVATILLVGALRRVPAVLDRARRAPLSPRLALLAACVVGAVVSIHTERLPQLDIYFAIRRYLELAALSAALFGLALFDRPAGRRTVLALALATPAMVFSLPFLFPSSGARLALASRAFVASPVTRALRHVVDLDGDGYSPLLGGGDCNDLNASVHPFQRDPPGDGIDQDCDGVDGWTDDPGPEAPPPGADVARNMADLRARARGKNVLVILVDALRFDRLRPPKDAAFPRLAGIWGQGVSFERALSPASRTPLAVPAILDGATGGPGNHLFHALHAAGYAEGFVSIDVVLDQLHLDERLSRDVVDLVGIRTDGERSTWGGGVHVFTGDAVTGGALHWIDARANLSAAQREGAPAPWLLWVHYFDAHQWDAIDAVHGVAGMPGRYDAALAYDDRAIGDLLDGLAARGLADDTIVVLLADHGESLGDHGFRTHGWYLYPELVHVPMSIAVPGVGPRVVSTVVPSVALTPTLLDLLGFGAPCGETLAGDAPSLLPWMAGAPGRATLAPDPVAMHDTFQSAIALDDRMLRFTPEDNATELFALDALDAPRPDDLAAREPQVALRMSRALVSRLPVRDPIADAR